MDVSQLLSTFTFTSVQAAAIFFGVIWTTVNFYTYTPILKYGTDRLVERVTGRSHATSVDPQSVPQSEWPTVEVFISAYDEAAVIEQAIRSTLATEYPSEKRTVTVLTEPGDDETNAVVSSLREELEFVHRVVPEGYPGSPNKPRALNYGFAFSDAEVIGVIDAEDVVGETLLSQAAVTISAGKPDFVHGVLDMVNENDGWLNLLFRAEYGYWFRLVAPGFVASGFDIPLPGTTCFFDREVLTEVAARRVERLGETWTEEARTQARELGIGAVKPWDPTNVTEDFEIGLILSSYGFDAGYVPAVTREESPLELNDWIEQRTRWQKGKVFTFLRYRKSLPKGINHKFHFLYQSLLPHLGPINISAVVIIFILSRLLAYEPLPIVRIVLSLGLAFMVIAAGATLVGYWLASDAPRRTRLRRSVIVAVGLFPYWVLQWGADLRALHRTYLGRFHWEHTTHLGRNLTESITESRRDTEFDPTYTLDGLHRELLLAVVLVGAVLLRLPRLGTQSLWTDEIYSVAVRASLSVPDLLVMPQDPHPPLYYLLLRGWMTVFGTSPGAVRAFSVLCSVAAVYVAYSLATRLFDDRTGLVVAALLAVSVFHIHVGRTARMYALFVFLTTVSWYSLLDVRTGSLLQRAGYAVATAAVLYVHVFGVFVVAAQWAYLAVSAPPSGDRGPERRAVAGVGVLSLPLVYLFGQVVYRMATSTGPSLDWIPAPTADLLSRIGLLYAGYPEIYPILGGSVETRMIATVVAVLFLVAIAFSIFEYDGENGFELSPPRANAQMLALAVVPIGGPLLVSLLYEPVLVPRYTIPATVGVFVLVANGLTNVPVRSGRIATVAVVLVGLLAMGGVYHSTDSFEDWQGAANAIETEASDTDAIVYQPQWTDTDVEYYYDGPALTSYRLPPDDGDLSAADRGRLREVVTTHEQFWYVQYGAPYDAPTSRWLRENAAQESVQEFGIVTVYRFTVPEEPDRTQGVSETPRTGES
ncbi:Dolichyl-phosphate-mannose-protein mannosyltransferase [Halogranum gelatinilyticum]|uniref:Dolichyl-phosphate-mannose-protein mannosyltransferase n=1 Tax=Halogranum gelatinilyticum TaxID=660521 RepID=A0A1G9XR54_9EURY|nr:glycosyltransferase [Halogranum gelatinilyticum]SDM99248.1 Dolichyl-phosphate-mannose-protein mannosyltransferase [Halogranum gelatinilyticum]